MDPLDQPGLKLSLKNIHNLLSGYEEKKEERVFANEGKPSLPLY